MTEHARIEKRGDAWRVLHLRGPETPTRAAWICLGRCHSQAVAVRLWLALVASGGRE